MMGRLGGGALQLVRKWRVVLPRDRVDARAISQIYDLAEMGGLWFFTNMLMGCLDPKF